MVLFCVGYNFIIAQNQLQQIPGIRYLDHTGLSIRNIYEAVNDGKEPGKEKSTQIEIRWLEDDNKVLFAHQFEKLELGVSFTIPHYTVPIQAFLEGRSGNQTINPYDREDLNIQADFYRIQPMSKAWEGPLHKEAFYFQDFERYIDEDNYQNSKWIKKTTDNPFRIRFTPREQGQWVCVFTIEVQGKEKAKAFFKFWVLPTEDSKSKDFLFVDSNKNYFATYNHKGIKEGFFGVGQNIPDVSCYDCQNLPCAGLEMYCGENTDMPLYPEVYRRYLQELDEASANGVNYFRTLIAPYNFEIEFEEINDYTGRLNCAWELDQVIQKLKENEMRVHLNLQVHYVLDMPNLFSIQSWDWTGYNDQRGCSIPGDRGYCYHTDLGLKESLLFFTNERAKYHYKNRLRYLISRYGYSSNIGLLELFSEINGFGAKPVMKVENRNGNRGCYYQGYDWGDKYYKRDSVPNILETWQKEMFHYIKNELGHTDHMTTVSYTGYPYTDTATPYYGGCDVVGGDSIYFSDLVDLWTFNFYSNDVLKNKHAEGFANQFGEALDKPLMYSEIGHSDDFMHCDSLLSYKDVVIMSPFSGLASTGLNWSYFHNTEDQWRHFRFMSQFMNQLDFPGQQYQPRNQLNEEESILMIYLDATGKKSEKAGVIANLTVNYITKATDYPCADTTKLYPDKPVYRKLQQLQSKNEFVFENMGAWHPYMIEYYYPLTGATIKKVKDRSNLFGKLKLDVPMLDTNIDRSRILFRVTSLKSESHEDSTQHYENIYASQNFKATLHERYEQITDRYAREVISVEDFLKRKDQYFYFLIGNDNKIKGAAKVKEDLKDIKTFNHILEIDQEGRVKRVMIQE